MSRLGIALIGLAMTVAPLSARAQPIGSLIGHEAGKADLPAIMDKFYRCAIERQPAAAGRWLDILPGSDEETKLIRELETDFDACISEGRVTLLGLRIKAVTFRQNIARLMLQRRFPVLPDKVDPQALEQPWFQEKVGALDDKAKLNRAMLMFQSFAFCVAKSDWAGTVALLRTVPDSKAEAEAVHRILPLFGGCLPPKLTLSIDRPQLRAVMTEGVYHILARSPSSTAVSQLNQAEPGSA